MENSSELGIVDNLGGNYSLFFFLLQKTRSQDHYTQYIQINPRNNAYIG